VSAVAGQEHDRFARLGQLFLALRFKNIADQKAKGDDAAGGQQRKPRAQAA
jgi:hypothetical protein